MEGTGLRTRGRVVLIVVLAALVTAVFAIPPLVLGNKLLIFAIVGGLVLLFVLGYLFLGVGAAPSSEHAEEILVAPAPPPAPPAPAPPTSKAPLWLTLCVGVALFALGVVDLYGPGKLPWQIDVSFIAAGAGACGVRVLFPTELLKLIPHRSG